jgi:hypothetical protein
MIEGQQAFASVLVLLEGIVFVHEFIVQFAPPRATQTNTQGRLGA